MKHQSVETEVSQLLSQTFKLTPNLIRPAALLKDNLGLDSVDLMDALCLLEEKFKVKIINQNLPAGTRIETVADLNRLVRDRISTKI